MSTCHGLTLPSLPTPNQTNSCLLCSTSLQAFLISFVPHSTDPTSFCWLGLFYPSSPSTLKQLPSFFSVTTGGLSSTCSAELIFYFSFLIGTTFLFFKRLTSPAPWIFKSRDFCSAQSWTALFRAFSWGIPLVRYAEGC